MLNGTAGPSLLDICEAERRPVAATNVQRSLENAANLSANTRLLRIRTPPVFQPEVLGRLWNGLDQSAVPNAGFAADVVGAIASQSIEFAAHNIECGYTYTSAAVLPDGTDPAPTPDPSGSTCRMRVQGTRFRMRGWTTPAVCGLPVMDLVRAGRFLLIAGEDGEQWHEAAANVAAVDDIGLDAVRIGHLVGDYRDPRSAWVRYRGPWPVRRILGR